MTMVRATVNYRDDANRLQIEPMWFVALPRVGDRVTLPAPDGSTGVTGVERELTVIAVKHFPVSHDIATTGVGITADCFLYLS